MKFRKYTKEQFIEAIASSSSIRQALRKLNVVPHGGNYHVAKSYIKKLNLDISHMKGQGWNKGQNFGPKRPIEDYLSNKHSIQSNKLRKRLIREEFFAAKCCICDNTTWNNKPIPLELDHINGNHQDNTLSNLRIICPNCHAQTDTYRGKNKKKL